MLNTKERSGMELAIYEAFRGAGVDEEKAKDIAANLNANFNTTINTTVNKAVEHHYAVRSPQTATKGDVGKVRLDVEKLRLDVEQLRLEIERVRLETKADIEKVRAGIEKSKNDIIRWMFGAIIAAAGIAMAIARIFFTA